MKFFAVDFNSVFRRNWEAAEGKDFGLARSRTVTQIQENAHGYDRTVLGRDAPPSFRKATYAGYKAKRTDPGEAFREQAKLALADLRALGMTVWASPSLGQWQREPGATPIDLYGEADDVLASFALWYEEHSERNPDWNLRVFSGDHDLWALVDATLGIDVMTLDRKVITEHEVAEEFGVAPYLVPEVKALAGDTSDEYRFFPGIGEKTAAAIVLAAVERAEGERCSTDAVFRMILDGRAVDGLKLKSNQVEAIKAGGLEKLKLARSLATLRDVLRRDGERWEPIDFSSVLAEPVMQPRRRPKDPDPTSDGERQEKPKTPPAAPLAVAAPASAAAQHDLPFTSSLRKAMTFAGEMYDSGIFQAKLPNPAACLMVVEYARAFRVPAVILAQHAGVVKGKMGFGAQMTMAIVLAHHETKCFRFTGDMKDRTVQQVKYHRAYSNGDEEKGIYPYTIEDARRAGVLDGKHSEQWTKAPHVMLRWAAARECARTIWPEVTIGMRGRDELEHGGMVEDQGEFPEEMIQEDAAQ